MAAAAVAGGKRRGSSPPAVMAAGLTIVGVESLEERIERLIRENPVIIFSRRGCCMSHVMKRLLATVSVQPTAIELEAGAEEEEAASFSGVGLPALFIRRRCSGGAGGPYGLHLRGRLVWD